jgi:HPr kinase/phosphorylase
MTILVSDLLNNPNLPLRLLAGGEGLNRQISSPELNRPTSELHGYFSYFRPERIQILGMGEIHFIEDRKDDPALQEALRRVLDFDIPCIVVSNDQPVPDFLVSLGNERKVPIFVTPLHTTLLSKRLWDHLEIEFAPSETIHGGLVEVHDVGVLILGEPGIGKSESALELVVRGHRLVADDYVKITCLGGSVLVGEGSDILAYHMEIRGIGIVDVRGLYGAQACRPRQNIGLVAQLERWQEGREYERVGLTDLYYEILKVKIPSIMIPVMPGRHISTIIELAALDRKLRNMGVHAAQGVSARLTDRMAGKDKVSEEPSEVPRSRWTS